MTQDALYNFVHQLNTSYVGPSLVFVLLGAGIFLTIHLGFVPRFYGRTIRQLLHQSGSQKASRTSGMSPLQALALSIASQVGTGNIVGVAMALLMGGPGSLFWLWSSTTPSRRRPEWAEPSASA